MVAHNTSTSRSAFTVFIEARRRFTTGVPATDRVTTIRTCIADDCNPEDLNRPVMSFPFALGLRRFCQTRAHTEGRVDLMRLAGFYAN